MFLASPVSIAHSDGMGRPPSAEKTTRKNVTFPDTLWDALDDARRTFPGRVPTQAEAIRVLLAEAIEARKAAAK